MSALPAYCFRQEFAPEPPRSLTFDRHYLLYAAEGSLRLETQGRVWSLPPSRAAWIAAGEPLEVTIGRPMICCSVLFAPGFIEPPPEPCKVFAVTPLAREMILECQRWGPEAASLDAEAEAFFRVLAAVCRRLAAAPSESWIPSGRGPAVRRAIAFTEAHLDGDPSFAAVAGAAAVSPRSLSRRFAAETGMTWRQVQRRLRMVRAVELVGAGEAVTEVALAVGYDSLSAFTAAFRDFAGASPRQFRAAAVRPEARSGS